MTITEHAGAHLLEAEGISKHYGNVVASYRRSRQAPTIVDADSAPDPTLASLAP